jgi:hypothetical protein
VGHRVFANAGPNGEAANPDVDPLAEIFADLGLSQDVAAFSEDCE